jgi:hypothetical protein
VAGAQSAELKDGASTVRETRNLLSEVVSGKARRRVRKKGVTGIKGMSRAKQS